MERAGRGHSVQKKRCCLSSEYVPGVFPVEGSEGELWMRRRGPRRSFGCGGGVRPDGGVRADGGVRPDGGVKAFWVGDGRARARYDVRAWARVRVVGIGEFLVLEREGNRGKERKKKEFFFY